MCKFKAATTKMHHSNMDGGKTKPVGLLKHEMNERPGTRS